MSLVYIALWLAFAVLVGWAVVAIDERRAKRAKAPRELCGTDWPMPDDPFERGARRARKGRCRICHEQGACGCAECVRRAERKALPDPTRDQTGAAS